MLLKQDHEANKMDPRVVRTRQLLQQALLELVGEKSFQAITVQDIADRATVNRVTFYAHFENKFALLEYAVREMIRQRLRSQVPKETPFSRENLARLVQTVCEFLAEMDRRCPPPHGQLEPLMEKQIKAELTEILRGWLGQTGPGAAQGRPTADQTAMIASWAIYGAAVQWSQQGPSQPAGEYVRQVLPLILNSLQTAAD